MRQFIDGTDRDFIILENKAMGKCIRFKNEEMPPDSIPARANVGFEVEPLSGKSVLWVDRDVIYGGGNGEIAAWLANGRKDFRSFDDLVLWIRTALAPEYGAETGRTAGGETGPRENRERRRERGLTDYRAVREGLPDPVTALYIDEERLATKLKEKVKGQEYAVKALAGVVARHCAREKPSRPAVLFSVGPTGVGKTRTAEILPEALKEAAGSSINNDYTYLRLDMTEYQEAHRVSQLLGAPQGYVGHGEGSQLVDTLRRNPRTIVLFDEIEKAHPAVLKVLMNAMDAGRLSAPAGENGNHEIDCRGAIFIFTSNLNAHAILEDLADHEDMENKGKVDEICRRHLRASGILPEILGRIGRFLVYLPLAREERAEILALSISEVGSEYGVSVVYISPEIILHIIRKAGEGDFGVRPAKYLIDEELGPVFARAARKNHKRIILEGMPYSYSAA